MGAAAPWGDSIQNGGSMGPRRGSLCEEDGFAQSASVLQRVCRQHPPLGLILACDKESSIEPCDHQGNCHVLFLFLLLC